MQVEPFDPRTLHIVNPLWNAAGGSELHAIELYRALSPHAKVQLWTEHEPDRDFADFPVQRINEATGNFPQGGTLIFLGVYQLPGGWIARARPRRTIVVYNMLLPRQLIRCMRLLFEQVTPTVEIVYVSEKLKQQTKLRGIVVPSLIDLTRFAPRGLRSEKETPFTIGRHSREDPRKHDPADVPLYHTLAAENCRVRIMGGRCLTAWGANSGAHSSQLELLPTKSEPAENFLGSLDCFYYRTGENFWEAFGRVVHEAMACGLPVVCHNRGGYVTSIQQGQTGFLFDTSDEALAIIRQLRADPQLCQRVGACARAAMEELYCPAARSRIIDYYLM